MGFAVGGSGECAMYSAVRDVDVAEGASLFVKKSVRASGACLFVACSYCEWVRA